MSLRSPRGGQPDLEQLQVSFRRTIAYFWIVCRTIAFVRAAGSGAIVEVFSHNSTDDLRQKLAGLRAKASQAGILVVTEALFSMDADSPKLPEVIDICKEHEAYLLVDVAHDLGATGPHGTGEMGLQGVLGQVDFVMGSFSKVFASCGGFVASSSWSAIEFMRLAAGSTRASNGLSAVQAAVACAAADIVSSPEGEARRSSLAGNSEALRDLLGDCLGKTAPMVIAPLASIVVGRELTRRLYEQGVLVSLIEYPAVPVKSPRIRFQLMADHSADQIVDAANLFRSNLKAVEVTAEG